MSEPDNIIPFNPNPDFKPLTSEELEQLSLDGIAIDENNEVSINLNKENCSLFIIELEKDKWIGFIGLTSIIEDKEDLVETANQLAEQYPDMICVNEQDVRWSCDAAHPQRNFSSIVIILKQ